MKKVKNIDSVEHTWVGQTIPSGEYFEIESTELGKWQNDASFITSITNAEAVMNDGESDITDIVKALDFLKDKEPIEVVTLFEKNDKDLKIASFAIEVDTETGEAEGVVAVGAGGRYVDAGIAWFDTANALDRIKHAELVDLDNIFGYGSGFVVKCLHDDDISEENQGWRIPYKRGHVEVDTMAGYGYIPEGLYIRVLGVKDPSNKSGYMFFNIKWGKIG
jgi:hypothetical protein